MELESHKSKVPCKKSDDDSYMETPCHFLLQIDDSLVQIDTKFHDVSMSFTQILFVFHAGTYDMDFGQVQVMEFPWHLLRK